MVAGHFRRHQFFAAGLALGIGVADPALLVVRDARGHRARRHEDCGHMAESRCRHDEARHDLVADAQIQGCVEAVVAHRHPGCQSDHVAAEQRKLHPRLALGDPVAHRRDSARDLHRDPRLCRRRPDQVGVAFEGLVGREHVVVGRHDPEVRHPCCGQSVFRLTHRRIGMGLVAAAEMRPHRTVRDGLPQSFQIAAAHVRGTGADAVGHLGDGRVKRHGGLRSVTVRSGFSYISIC